MKYFMLLLFLSFSVCLYAGIVKGKISDAKTGEPLIGATVTLEGVSKKLKTSVNLDGSYSFRNVPIGSYTIKVHFAGYKTSEFKNIEIKAATDIVTINGDLNEEIVDLGEVQVNTFKGKESNEAAKLIEKNSDVVTNVMSAKTIELSPDVTVSNSLQRMSGVSFQSSSSGEGRYAIIRGMDQRYNTTLVNGVPIPSPDDRFRSVPMNLFPSDILQRLEVIKALTPSMEGNAIGGVMNLIMKDAPNKQEFRIFAAGGGNTIFNERPFYSFQRNSINKKSPYEITSGADATIADFPKNNLKIASQSQPFNLQTGFTYGNRYLHKKLGVVLSLSYQNIYRGTNQTLITEYPAAIPLQNAYGITGNLINNYPIFDQVFTNTISVQQKRFGLNNKIDYVINQKNKISLYNLYVNLNEFETRQQSDTDINANLGKLTFSTRTMWRIQSIYNSTLHGEHQLASRTTLNWTGTYSYASQQIPDLASFGYDGSYQKSPNPLRYFPADSGIAGGMSRRWTHNNDQDVAGYLNLIINRNIAHRNVEFSIGTMFRDKTRNNFYRSYSLSVAGSNPQNISNIDSFAYQFNPSSGNPASGDSGIARNYTITEDVAAAYWQFKLMATPKLQVIGGVRFENTDEHYKAVLTDKVNAKYGHIYYYDILPSLHLKYAIDNRQNVRASYFRSFIRPSFVEIVPSDIPASETSGYEQQGNPYVKHTTADNYDLRYELYPQKGADQLLAGVFLKDIHNPIEVTFSHNNMVGGNSNVSRDALVPSNVGNVKNLGFEFLVTKYFGKFGVNANYTYTHSATTTQKNFETIDSIGQIITLGKNQTRPLQGQAKHIGNISLLFKDHKIGLDMQLSYVYTGERIQLVNTYYNLDTWQSPFGQLDFSFTKKVIKKLEVYGKILNITNEQTNFFIKTPYYNYYKNTNALPFQVNPTKNIFVEKDIFKTSYLLGVRYKI